MIVIKAGGNGSVDMEAVYTDIVRLNQQGEQLVLVHGGSQETNIISKRLGHPPRFVTSPSGYVSRYTDRETLQIFSMVTAGRINKRIVERLQQLGVNAIGLSGLDGRLLQAKRKKAIKIVENGKCKLLRGDYSGRIEQVNVTLLQTLLTAGYVPVIAPLALSYQGEALNVDADRVAAAISSALKADTLVILSDVPGLLRCFPDESTIIRRIAAQHLESHLETHAQGRMKKKLLGAIEAIRGGVERVVISDGRIAQPLYQALAGQGTVIAR